MPVLRRDKPTRQQVLRPLRDAVRERRRAALRVAGILPPRHLAEKILTSPFVRREELGRGGASRSIAARGLSRCRRVRHRAPPVPTNRSARACPAYDRVHGRGGTAELLTGARARLGVRSG